MRNLKEEPKPMKKNKETERYTKYRELIRDSKEIFSFSDVDTEFINSVAELNAVLINQVFDKQVIRADNEDSLINDLFLTPLFYLSREKDNLNYSKLVKEIIKYRTLYEKKFYRGKNAKEKRNPYIQMLTDVLLQSINTLVISGRQGDSTIKEIFQSNNTRGADRYDYISENFESIDFNEKYVSDVLSGIDNIVHFGRFDIDNTNYNNFFLVIVNTHKDIDDINSGSYMLNVKSEILTLNRYFNRHNIRNLILINPYSEDILNLLHSFKPKSLHYIGHSENGFLRFRKKQRIFSYEIGDSYSPDNADYVFLNSCISSDIADELKQLCFKKSIGYQKSLLDKIAILFSEKLYHLINPMNIKRNFKPIFDQAIISSNTIDKSGEINYYRLFE